MSIALQHVALPDSVTRQTVEDARWWKRALQPLQDNEQVRVEIQPAQTAQTWQGFGGAASEIAWRAVSALPEQERERFFQSIFGRDGLGLDWIRLPIGASDFALDAYSASETPDDDEMTHFSIERDRQALIPFIRRAQAVNPRLRVHASPWSPPAWMKESGRMDGTEKSVLRDDPRVWRVYARYLRKFVEAYREEGIPIERLMVQNEMDSPAGFPSCAWTPQAFVRFHLEFLRPEFETAGLDTEIWAGTFRSISGHQAHDCFMDSAFRSYVKGAAFQYSGSRELLDFQCTYPGTRVMHTESVCHNGANTPEQAATQFDDFIEYAGANIDVFTYWNILLDGERRSAWGWRQNSLCTVEADRLTMHPDYEVFKLLSEAVPAGAVRVRCFNFLLPTVCFRLPDGSFRVLLRNPDGPRRAQIHIMGQKDAPVELPGRSLCVITC